MDAAQAAAGDPFLSKTLPPKFIVSPCPPPLTKRFVAAQKGPSPRRPKKGILTGIESPYHRAFSNYACMQYILILTFVHLCMNDEKCKQKT